MIRRFAVSQDVSVTGNHVGEAPAASARAEVALALSCAVVAIVIVAIAATTTASWRRHSRSPQRVAQFGPFDSVHVGVQPKTVR